ncbi:hypothetical protein SAMN05421781_0413 [Marinococcus luteus]|uniref:Uncharacterized protein n=1 Tax=Marinococcus luteus TaxID=1122204 RepID=A0A1H2QPT8_9BACI|nr:hypothetical protein SAMN05421781_0413 [Marinococcus luteus]
MNFYYWGARTTMNKFWDVLYTSVVSFWVFGTVTLITWLSVTGYLGRVYASMLYNGVFALASLYLCVVNWENKFKKNSVIFLVGSFYSLTGVILIFYYRILA